MRVLSRPCARPLRDPPPPTPFDLLSMSLSSAWHCGRCSRRRSRRAIEGFFFIFFFILKVILEIKNGLERAAARHAPVYKRPGRTGFFNTFLLNFDSIDLVGQFLESLKKVLLKVLQTKCFEVLQSFHFKVFTFQFFQVSTDQQLSIFFSTSPICSKFSLIPFFLLTNCQCVCDQQNAAAPVGDLPVDRAQFHVGHCQFHGRWPVEEGGPASRGGHGRG